MAFSFFNTYFNMLLILIYFHNCHEGYSLKVVPTPVCHAYYALRTSLIDFIAFIVLAKVSIMKGEKYSVPSCVWQNDIKKEFVDLKLA